VGPAPAESAPCAIRLPPPDRGSRVGYPERPIIPIRVAWLTQSRDEMIQLHKPRERAAGSGIRPGVPKVLVPIALLDDPGTPRAHARGVRFCAEGGFHV